MGLAAGLWGSAPSAVRFQKPQMIFGGMAGFGVESGFPAASSGGGSRIGGEGNPKSAEVRGARNVPQ